MPAVQSKNYTVTYYPGGDGHHLAMDEIEWDTDHPKREDEIEYMAYGMETCPTTQREHAQMFVCFKKKKTLGAAIKVIQSWLEGAHVEIMKGTLQHNEKYCSKEGELREWGVKPTQGSRTDLTVWKDKIMSGEMTTEAILLEDPIAFHQYGRTFEKLEAVKRRKTWRTTMTKGIWYWGPTGCGKSRKAMEDYNPDTHYICRDEHGTMWFDGYDGHDIFILDEFRGNLPYRTLLQMADRHPYWLPVRGKEAMPFLASKVIVTSALPPKEVYNNLAEKDSLDQLLRRFEVIRLGPEPVAPVFHARTPPVADEEI